MADRLTIDVDTRGLIAALDRIPGAILERTRVVARETARNIATETSRRYARRAAGPTRGGQHTADTITVEETRNRDGYLVYAKSPAMPNLPLWLEFGTKVMQAHPIGGALFPSARLEEGAHDRKIRDAVQDAINANGLGE